MCKPLPTIKHKVADTHIKQRHTQPTHILRHVVHHVGEEGHDHEDRVLEADEDPQLAHAAELVGELHGVHHQRGVGDHRGHGGDLQDGLPGADVLRASGHWPPVTVKGTKYEHKYLCYYMNEWDDGRSDQFHTHSARVLYQEEEAIYFA